MKNLKKRVLAGQSGFTLIEIIAVLVILGILAAVAVPKFINLTEDAQEKAFEGALAAGFSNVTLSYSRYILKNNGTVPTNIVKCGDDYCWQGAGSNTIIIEADLGDYTIKRCELDTSGSNTVVVIQVEDSNGNPSDPKSFAMP